MRYVVYVHKENDGTVFYVGHGTLERAKTMELSETSGIGSGRGKRYSSFVKTINFSYCVEILKSNLNKQEAIEHEIEIYNTLVQFGNLTNTRKPNAGQVKLCKSELTERFVYDETSPSCLNWKVDRVNRGGLVVAEQGMPAGYLSASGYFFVKFNNKTIPVHRIIATLFDMDIDGMFVDHINRCRSDNKVSNLRSVSPAENNRNKGIGKNSSSGIQGVTYSGRYNRWRVSMSYNGKEHCTYFPCRECGYEVAKQLAIDFRKEKMEQLIRDNL